MSRYFWIIAFAAALPPQTMAQSGVAKAVHETVERDGQHDFDFEVGTWKIHLRRLLHPLSGSNEWIEYDGTSVTRKVWDGRSNIEEFEVDDPVSHAHIEG